jgi:hypothetical protein
MAVYTSLNGKKAGFGEIYKEAEGDKKSFAVIFMNVELGYKDEATGYQATVPVKIIASGHAADRLHAFENNEFICIDNAQLSKDSDYTNADGELVKGGIVFRAISIANWPANYNANKPASAAAPTKAPSKAPSKAPAKGKPSMPKRPAVNS